MVGRALRKRRLGGLTRIDLLGVAELWATLAMTSLDELAITFARLSLRPQQAVHLTAAGFLDLPAELRNQIYELLVRQQSDTKEDGDKPLLTGGILHARCSRPGLRYTRRQMRQEFTPYWSAQYRLVLSYSSQGPGWSVETTNLLGTLDEQAIRNIMGFALDFPCASVEFHLHAFPAAKHVRRYSSSSLVWNGSKHITAYTTGPHGEELTEACMLLLAGLRRMMAGREPAYLTKAEVEGMVQLWD